MGLFDGLLGKKSDSKPSGSHGIISNGGQKVSGGHDHRSNKGDDRTPAQKRGDRTRRK